MTHKKLLAGCGIVCLALSGCGGGGGGGVASIPPPPVTPPPPPPPPVTGASISIFPNPQVGEFASIGASAKGSDFVDLNAPLGTISTADANQPHIRYTASGTYEIELPGGPLNGFTWHSLSLYPGGGGPNVLTDDTGDLLLVLSGSKDKGYQYSEVARYDSGDTNDIGAFAFGMLTPAGAVPTTGSATYTGTVMGETDVIASDSFDGPNRATVEGTVNLNFDFANGSLAGSMTIGLDDDAEGPLALGTFNFKDTVFAAGSTSYSGKFDSSAAGDNFFLGKFTGPHGEETIGAWALPFILDVGNATITADHKAHQAFGAWIAKH